MSLTEIPVVGVVGFVVVGLVTAVGAFVVSLLLAGIARAGLQLAGWATRRARVAGAVAVGARAPKEVERC